MFRDWRRPARGFFDEFEKEIEEMNESVNRMMRSLGDKPLVYGFSLQVGPDGVPHVEHFGNVRPTGRGEDMREPFTSSMIDEKNNEFRITVEMPGVQKENIEVNATENEVMIKADGERKYYKRVKTPIDVDPDSAKAKYNNGILEVTFKFKEPSKQKGKTVKIE
ncbi:molecular chaperone (small heat shock protein) [Candidatus Methanoperedens nitroreducens]|uniref:Molecular chaperone (Small heat shock protein) n=1 Tax=Candidatus Methanoperedens nitratireducens TaxID=1392998 RepID=A0A062V9P4_9EURY|nr:archaeal heat shock protein Hsp20 [Candidatus Methanoperedens nitroreducens]KCZ72075.1 molecular chaperone (small heat shock protein) [Candidatus Methanoperedens nitroreducens]MDJ1421950.1 Hsp20/alpha crystallin family protein [Candidatus Methanoperedens sp.]